MSVFAVIHNEILWYYIIMYTYIEIYDIDGLVQERRNSSANALE